MVAPDEREFTTFRRGQVRDDIILASFRNALRVMVNPSTGLTFTEDEIARATQPGSRFYIEADAIDLFGMSNQARAAFLADQIDPRRANTSVLDNIWGRLWLGPESRLAATGGSGDVLAKGVPGTIFSGSTTIGDPTAVVGTDPNGLRFQVLQTEALAADGTARLTLKGIDTGFETNLKVGTVLTWSQNVPLGADPQAAVVDTIGQPGVGFQGGFDVETDEEYANRIEERMRERPAAGNAPHFQAWSQQANGSVEQAFVYPIALNAGSVVIAITQRRNQTQTDGPLGKFPSIGTLVDVTNFLTPPASPVVPQRVFALVVSPQSQPSDLVVRISMNQGSGGGWQDVVPWPNPAEASPASATPVTDVAVVTTQLDFDVNNSDPLPGGAASLSGTDAPAIMIWNDSTSRFEQLAVDTITDNGVTKNITLTAAPSKTVIVGDRVSPFTDRLTVIAEALELFFDSLGPGEILPKNDPRFSRAARQPRPNVKFPFRAGQGIISVLVDALGGVAPDAELSVISRTDPDLPANVSDGPNKVTLGKVTIYPLP